ncbi:transposase [Cuniculiplasma sp. SKW4]|uniref:transposase n=1 Tax=Cuniculiplasma sp. SKW4 TaxID=3400171 RepID=UPI003FD60A06
MRGKCWGNYKDPYGGLPRTINVLKYGGKCHTSVKIDTLQIMGWSFTKGNIHDSKVSQDMLDSLRNFSHFLTDSDYDISDIYDYRFKNAYPSPIIDTKEKEKEFLN